MRIQVVGRLTGDAELKTAGDGSKFISFDVAENRRKSDGTQEVTYLRVTMADAPRLFHYLKKGTQLFVEGRGNSHLYVGRDGVARASLRINTNASGITLLGGGQNEQDTSSNHTAPSQQVAPAPEPAPRQQNSDMYNNGGW